MTYTEATQYLFTQLPMFQKIGAGAYKPGLDTVLTLLDECGNPHRKLRAIHIAGTNGKGSTAHSLAAILQRAGYRTGLFTSPHLLDFRERIRIDGEMVSQRDVTEWVEHYLAKRKTGKPLQPSFFELTTAMAFDLFARAEVDIAVVECGLGGRLDSTNVLSPILSIITNISLDHTSLLGDTVSAIAAEKAGIIKPGVPVVYGPDIDPEARSVFEQKAAQEGVPAIPAEPCWQEIKRHTDCIEYLGTPWGDLRSDLTGDCQPLNMATILTATRILENELEISTNAVRSGVADVCGITGLAGRWMKTSDNPLTICDTGHNPGGWVHLSKRLSAMAPDLTVVLGFAADKDVAEVLKMLPASAHYIFTQASTPRALPAERLLEMARGCGIDGTAVNSVEAAWREALADGRPIFIGGSTFVVAEYLEALQRSQSE